MRNIIIIIAIILIGLGIHFYFQKSEPLQIKGSSNEARLAKENGAKMPEFALKSLNGDVVNAKEHLEGTGGYIHFWASWCAPCVVEFPKMIEYARQNPSAKILAISSDFKQVHITQFFDVNKEWGELPENIIVLRDENAKITGQLFQTFKLPETIIISKDLKMVDKHSGMYEWE
ncbi:MAG: hypothetical protein CMP22_00590 [Rickettsiales bacterium]|nr:hypothetical protein [Rickettsiales bacterium]|tara:strand:+ start:55 stop:576 length:522 start_codon:yes stop_codon:yes gene_type:complete